MKKRLFSIFMCIAILMGLLASCDDTKSEQETKDVQTEESTSEESAEHSGKNNEIEDEEEDDEVTEGLEYEELSDGTYGVRKGKTGDYVKIVIPESYNGKPVTHIFEYGVSEMDNLKKIVIPKSITSIGEDCAFEDCPNLTKIIVQEGNEFYHSNSNCLIETDSKTLILGCQTSVIPSDGSVTRIGVGAFEGCNYLTSITIPDTVTTIEMWAFRRCGLTSITIPDSVTEIGWYAFSGNPLTSVTIPNSVVYTNSSFAYCDNLKSITISDKMTNISNREFVGCTALMTLTIPNSVTSIGWGVFEGCTGLTTINFSGTKTQWNSIEKEAKIPSHCTIVCTDGNITYDTEVLKYVLLDDGTYGVEMGTTQELETVKIPATYEGKSVTKILDYAFSYCISLTSITIPDSVTSIGKHAFDDCISLTSVYIPDSVTSIGEYAFCWCKSLTSITIPDSITYIDEYVFSDCSSLTSITIPDSVTGIGYGAFEGCTSLKKVYITDIEAWCNIEFRDYDYTSNPMYSGTSLYLNNELVTELKIPDSVTLIGNYAFYGCTSFKSVTIPDSVTSIGEDAFSRCSSLTNVIIPDSVTSIGAQAFEDCTSLTSIAIPNSVTSIGSSAFEGCTNLKYNEYYNAYYLGNDANPYLVLVRVKYTSITSFMINEKTKLIYPRAFYDCDSLTSVYIPDSVTSIGNAFSGCTSLTSITFNGTRAQWNSISKETLWICKIIYCTDGNIIK